MSYSKQEIEKIINVILNENEGANLLYTAKLLNYKSKLTDKNTDQSTQDYIAEYLLDGPIENNGLLDAIGLYEKEKQPYRVDFDAKHSGKFNFEVVKNQDYKVTEKRLAIALFNSRDKVKNVIGDIIDYQVPLKKEKKDKRGEVDLLAVKDNRVKLIELKPLDSPETLLRAVMEVFTYYRILKESIDRGSDSEKRWHSQIKNSVNCLQPVVLVGVKSVAAQNLSDMIEGKYPNLRRLLDRIDSFLHNNGAETFEFWTFNYSNKPINFERIDDSNDVKPYFNNESNLTLTKIEFPTCK